MRHPFDVALSVSAKQLEIEFKGFHALEWSEFWLNPRRLRGSDFLMRWSQGVWAENRLMDAVNETIEYFALPYGPSGTAPADDVRAYELYFERLEKAGLGAVKRPDILVFNERDRAFVEKITADIGGVAELPFIAESDLHGLISKSVLAIECENSLWVAGDMPAFGKPMTPQKRLDGKPGLPKTAVLPTVIIKEEDRQPLLKWQNEHKKAIHIWHVFFDRAYGLSLDEAERLLKEGLILPTVQVFQAPGGATTKKAIFKFYYHYAYPLGISSDEPKLVPDFLKDKNGHILPYVRFEGGSMNLTKEALEVLKKL